MPGRRLASVNTGAFRFLGRRFQPHVFISQTGSCLTPLEPHPKPALLIRLLLGLHLPVLSPHTGTSTTLKN
jgi:hypothetical protein